MTGLEDTTDALTDRAINVVGCRARARPTSQTRSTCMPQKIVDTILPTTMVGSYPRPHWFTQQLRGRDVRVAFKEVQHEEAYHDATHAVLHDQEEAGLDIVTDGQMSYDDYVGGIGSFCWYMYERIGGFDPAREEHPSITPESEHNRVNELLTDWGGVVNSGPVTRGPIRLVDLYKIASSYTDKPIKVSVGAGPVNLAWHVYFQHYKDAKELCYALAPLFTGDENDYEWISDVIGKCTEGVDAKIGWHFCFGNAWGNDILSANFPEGYQTVLPYFWDTPGIDQFVLDYANRDMAGIEFLANLPADKDVQVGVLDIRSMMI